MILFHTLFEAKPIDLAIDPALLFMITPPHFECQLLIVLSHPVFLFIPLPGRLDTVVIAPLSLSLRSVERLL